MTFLYDTGDGERVRAKIVKKIQDKDAKNHERIKMLISYDDDRVEELISYNELCDLVAEQHDKRASGKDEVFTFRRIVDHKGPLYHPCHERNHHLDEISVLRRSSTRW